MSITSKPHHIAVHFPAFAEKWLSLGKYGEHYIEQLRQLYSTTLTGHKKMKQLLKSCNIRNAIFYSAKEPYKKPEDDEDEGGDDEKDVENESEDELDVNNI